MDSNYYRKERPRKTILSWGLKQLKKKNVVMTLTLVVPALMFVLFSNKGVIARINLDSQKQELQIRLDKAKQDQKDLQAQSKALDKDPKAIEKVAREKYGMVRDGETVYKVKKDH
jgi:cell division protein FtsB